MKKAPAKGKTVRVISPNPAAGTVPKRQVKKGLPPKVTARVKVNQRKNSRLKL